MGGRCKLLMHGSTSLDLSPHWTAPCHVAIGLLDAEVVAVFALNGRFVGESLGEGLGVRFPLLVVLFVADQGDALDGCGAVDGKFQHGFAIQSDLRA